MNCLQVENLTKMYGEQKVVTDVSFTLENGTATALIGPNGAGKTTTLSMLAGLLKQNTGTIHMPATKDIRAEIGFLPQYPQFYSWLTALEYVEMCAQLSGISGKYAKEKAKKVLQFVGLEKAMGQKTSTFSGGMKQRLGIAQAIVHEPKLLLLDEPVSALDPVGRRQIMDLLKELQQTTTILYSTHVLHDAEQMTNQVLFLQKGRLVEQGSLLDVQKKYSESNIVIRLEKNIDASLFIQRWSGASLINDEVFIPATDTDLTMSQVIAYIFENGLNVKKVEKQSSSLEEIFLKVAEQYESV